MTDYSGQYFKSLLAQRHHTDKGRTKDCLPGPNKTGPGKPPQRWRERRVISVRRA